MYCLMILVNKYFYWQGFFFVFRYILNVLIFDKTFVARTNQQNIVNNHLLTMFCKVLFTKTNILEQTKLKL
jgi:hypothetical protein